MFTGLVQDLATIRNVERSAQSSVITIETALASQMQIGDSISINGVCLTATKIEGSLITVDVMADARLGGHIVQGHVDGVGQVVANEPGDKWQRFAIQIPPQLKKYVVNQGSICVDGVSLTVGEIEDSKSLVTLWLIPETLAKTTLGARKEGDQVNIEVDVLAKYVERLMKVQREVQ
jgi:riboflavin synthase